MFKIFNDVAIDTKKISAVYVDNVGFKNKYQYSVKAGMDNGDEWTLAEFGTNEDAAKNYLAKLVDVLDELNAD